MEKSALSRFNGAEAWGFLTLEQQATIGALALELVAAWAVDDEALSAESDPRIGRVACTFGDHVIIDLLQDEVSAALPRETVFDDTGAPRVPSTYGKICRACGCSQNDACDIGCSWVEDDLCSVCADDSPPPRLVYVHANAIGRIRFLTMMPADRMVLLVGPDAAVRELVAVHARHAYDGTTLLVPGIPEAGNSLDRLDALLSFQGRLDRAWAARESEVAS